MTEERKCRRESDTIIGLTSEEVLRRQEKYGPNELVPVKKASFIRKLLYTLGEPMFLLLLITAVIYFLLKEPADGAVMLVFVTVMISIDAIQGWKTDRTLAALKELSEPKITVIRDGKEETIASTMLVPGDYMIIYEGTKIPADGIVRKCNDLCIDESSLTGEAQGIWKEKNDEREEFIFIEQMPSEYWRKDYCYAGTLVLQGSGIIEVEYIGANTEYGKIGTNIANVKDTETPLQYQTRQLIRLCAGIAITLCIIVTFITYATMEAETIKERLIQSILSGITLAMAMIPEEFPVVLTVFLSMGAWRLARKQSLVRKLASVETLGEVSVLCVDKTGTVTKNQMTVKEVWGEEEKEIQRMVAFACETDAYDPMEKALLTYCIDSGIKEERYEGEIIFEYPFTSETKRMGHVWLNEEKCIIAAKGSPETMLPLCSLIEEEKNKWMNRVEEMTKKGLRVIAVAGRIQGKREKIPSSLEQCDLTLYGLIGLQDPPRENIYEAIRTCNQAGIRVVMITGDHSLTAISIGEQIGMDKVEETMTGEQIDEMSELELQKAVRTVSIFSRVIPEHKMRIVKAMKANGEIVAMTGDGVNDAPALKYADIGIAMGQRGSEVSREAADLILLDDNFTTIIETIKDGRRIYDNIRKAVGYIMTIHIPIALSSLLAPLLGVTPNALLLLPIHVVLLELLIDPTCSIVLERQPAEQNLMKRNPRKRDESLVSKRLIGKSVIQGLIIFLASFGLYYIYGRENPELGRSMGFVVLLCANVFLVQVNSSEYDFAFSSIKQLTRDPVMWAIHILTFLEIGIILYTPFSQIVRVTPLTVYQLALTIVVAFASVLWYELVKIRKRRNRVK